jgi:glycosyltransferase involved in cell wall biosynthesis
MRIKIIEGMAAQKCIVSTPIGAEGIEAENGEEIVIAEPIQFADALIAVMNDSRKIEKMGYKAKTFVETNYNWTSLIKEFESFYRQLV